MNNKDVLIIQSLLKRCYSMAICSQFFQEESEKLKLRDRYLSFSNVDQGIGEFWVAIMAERTAKMVKSFDEKAILCDFGITW